MNPLHSAVTAKSTGRPMFDPVNGRLAGVPEICSPSTLADGVADAAPIVKVQVLLTPLVLPAKTTACDPSARSDPTV